MRWIRNPWWDSGWMLGGFIISGTLIASPAVGMWIFTCAAVIVTAHEFSSIVLAWGHRGFRRHMLMHRRKYIGMPAIATLISLIAVNWPIGLWMVGSAWMCWNIYHFGMQNYGLVRMYGVRRLGWLLRIAMLGAVVFGMVIVPGLHVFNFTIPSPFPHKPQWAIFLLMGAFGFQHWVSAIGLATAAAPRWWLFLLVLIILGGAGFFWYEPRPGMLATRAVPMVLGLRYSLGFMHFLYDAWVYKFSAPHVRSTIGRELFSRT